MSIFGEGAPVIQNVETGQLFTLTNTSIKKYDFDDSDVTVYKYLSGHREFFEDSNHFKIKYTVYLNKFSDPNITYFTLCSFLKQKVNIKLHVKKRGGFANQTWVKDRDNNIAVFYVKSLIPYYLDSAGFYDAVDIELLSMSPMSVANLPTSNFISINTNSNY